MIKYLPPVPSHPPGDCKQTLNTGAGGGGEGRYPAWCRRLEFRALSESCPDYHGEEGLGRRDFCVAMEAGRTVRTACLSSGCSALCQIEFQLLVHGTMQYSNNLHHSKITHSMRGHITLEYSSPLTEYPFQHLHVDMFNSLQPNH
jgi:hypothetical protein